MKASYTKNHLTYQEQVLHLKDKNLTIMNADYAVNKLSHLNYYRLSAYFLPFYDDEKIKFRNESNFESIVDLYYFDKKLRNIIFYAIEKIEVYLRTQMAYILSKDFGAFGYTKSENFISNVYTHNKLMKDIGNEVSRSKEVFVKHFFSKYVEQNLPVWMMVEVISFGTLSKLYKALKPEQKSKITQQLEVPQKVLDSWFHTLVYTRNLCAHHSRVWNKMLAIKPLVPNKINYFKELNNKKIFFVLSLLEYLLLQIDDEEYYLKEEIETLLKLHPKVPTFNMGFPENWEELELWRR